MKKLLYFMFLLPFLAMAQPNWDWGKKITTSSTVQIRDTWIDASGNVYISGYYTKQNIFGTDTVNTTYSGAFTGTDAFVAKYDSTGAFQWVRHGGPIDISSGVNCSAEAVRTDAAGNVYIAGMINEDFIFGGITDTTAGMSDILLAKYDASGNFLWYRIYGGPTTDLCYGMDIDSNNDLYLTGSFSTLTGSAQFDTITVSSGNLEEAFVAKFDSAGNIYWLTHDGNGATNQGHDVTVGGGNVWFTGFFSNTIDFGSGPVTSMGNQDFFVAKVDASTGAAAWTNIAGSNGGYDKGTAVEANAGGEVFVAGGYDQVMYFGSDSINSAGQSLFLVSYDANGNRQWLLNGNWTGSLTPTVPNMTIDVNSNLYLTGSAFSGSLFGLTDPGGFSAGYIVKVDGSGSPQWMYRNDVSASEGIYVDGTGAFAWAGLFSVFDPVFGSDVLDGGNGTYTHGYVARGKVSVLAAMAEAMPAASKMQAWPIPARETLQVSAEKAGFRLELMSLEGKILQETSTQLNKVELNVSELPAGFYLLRMTAADGSVATKKIIIE